MPASSALASLVHRAEHLTRNSACLAERAKAACATALKQMSVTRLFRERRSLGATIPAHLQSDADHMVVLCAYCHRVHRENGWMPLPFGVEPKLKERAGIILSHGYCPDCVQAYFAPGLQLVLASRMRPLAGMC